ncbi:phage holin family protein [Lacrimispora sp. JR3]|uniref:phage holin family protein n=1 Tax=Lacrimispora sinapis TaxID=3111456 RepID=UPI00374874AA
MRDNAFPCLLGIYKKASYIFMILVAASTDYIIYKFSAEIGMEFPNKTIFALLVSMWLIINGLISIWRSPKYKKPERI